MLYKGLLYIVKEQAILHNHQRFYQHQSHPVRLNSHLQHHLMIANLFYDLRRYAKHQEHRLDNANQLNARRKTLKQFKVAGEDQRFYRAKARIKGNTVIVRTRKVPHPVAVRYAFESAAQGALRNEAGLPASSFRSDDWLISE